MSKFIPKAKIPCCVFVVANNFGETRCNYVNKAD